MFLYQLKKHGLITIDRKSNTVSRPPAGEAGTPLGDTALKRLSIPKRYWQGGWDRRLSFAAKYFYLIASIEKEDSPFRPWWRLSEKQIASRYGCDPGGMRRGARELEELGVLEILRPAPIKSASGYYQEAKYYRLNPL